MTVQRLARSPHATIPAAMQSEAELEGAYRLLRSRHVTQAQLTAGHANATAARAKAHSRVLAIHDTTTCDFAHGDPKELGYLSTGKAGFLAHYTLVVTADGRLQPLGVSNLETIFRNRPPSAPSKGGRAQRKKSGAETSLNHERESLRWLRGFRNTSSALAGCEVVHVADRESDAYEIFVGAVDAGLRFVIRVRLSGRKAQSEDGTYGTLRELSAALEGGLEREVALGSRAKRTEPLAAKAHPPRNARLARLSFSATRVTIRRPKYLSDAREALDLNLVRVVEVDAPAGEEPIEWLLFTTEPIATAADIAAVVDTYRARWLIEECNKALKSGCRYEERQLESRHALLNMLAITLPIACELLWLRAACRSNPNQPARSVLTSLQLKILAAFSSYVLPKNPNVHHALWAVAALGGHIRSNGEPGWLVLHRGMTKLLDFERGWVAREKLLEI